MAPVIAPPGILRRIDTTVELNVVFSRTVLFVMMTYCSEIVLKH